MEIVDKPFLRWAGGKNWLIKHIGGLDLSKFRSYHEPFLGGGAIFFSLKPKKAFLSDLNGDLIDTYSAIKIDAKRVISILKTFQNTENYYYEIRHQDLNDGFERAAKFIYLNQTSFNGIYRVNLKGVYNVPFGFRNKPFIEENKLISAQYALKNAELTTCDFYKIVKNIKRNDLVFLDPPYTVSHNKNGFIKYNEKIFQLQDQYRLSSLIDEIKRKDAYYILTNAAHTIIDEIFDKGDIKIELKRASLIGGHNSVRGNTTEFIFTNTKVF